MTLLAVSDAVWLSALSLGGSIITIVVKDYLDRKRREEDAEIAARERAAIRGEVKTVANDVTKIAIQTDGMNTAMNELSASEGRHRGGARRARPRRRPRSGQRRGSSYARCRSQRQGRRG